MTEPLHLWSVTTLIKQGLGTPEQLVNWNVEQAAKAAVHSRKTVEQMIEDEGPDAAIAWLKGRRWSESAHAAARGTLVHNAAEAHVLGQTVEVADNILPYVDQFKAWVNRHGPAFVMAEAPVYNTAMRYAGTLDGIMDVHDRRLLYDIKTTDKAPDSGRSRPPYSNVALQLCAYARATEVGVLSQQRYSGGKRYYVYDPAVKYEPMPKVDGALCIVVSPYDCIAVPVRVTDDVWETFRAVIKCAAWSIKGTTDLFGPPLPTPEAVAA